MSDNVTPIAPTDPPCASCGAVLRTADRYDPEKHDERCRQPEIRMRRVEGELERLRDILHQLIGQGNETVTNQVDLHKRLKELEEWRARQVAQINADTIALLRVLGERLDRLESRPEPSNSNTFILKEPNGTSEAIPDTQRSGAQQWVHGGRHPVNAWSTLCPECAAAGASELYADSRPTEPAGAPDAGADAPDA